MNSFVLKPCLCVVFFTYIPKVAPSGSGLRRAAGFATLTRLRVALAWAVLASGSRGRRIFRPFDSCRVRSSWYDDEFSLPLLSRGSHASFDDFLDNSQKKLT